MIHQWKQKGFAPKSIQVYDATAPTPEHLVVRVPPPPGPLLVCIPPDLLPQSRALWGEGILVGCSSGWEGGLSL